MISALRKLVAGLFTLLLTFILGAIFVHAGYTKLGRALRIRSEGQPIQAHVEGWQISSFEPLPSQYELSYGFDVNQRHFASGGFSQWEAVPYDDWVASRQTETIDVRYVAADPSVNAPSSRGVRTLAWNAMEMLVGALTCLSSVLAPLVLLVRRR